MTDNEAYAKLGIVVAVVLGAVAIGYLVVIVVLPLFLLGALIDYGMRRSYNKKLAEVRRSPDLIKGPVIHDFEARFVDGEVLIAWFCDLPGDAALEIYRIVGPAGGAISEMGDRALCIHTTGRELTNNRDEVFIDPGLEPGRYSYVPVVSGLVVEKEPIEYSFFDFAPKVQFIQRKNRRKLRGEASVVDVPSQKVQALPDERDAATKMADDVLTHLRERKKFDSEIDAAIDRIKASHDLTEDEKAEAIELIETRAVAP